MNHLEKTRLDIFCATMLLLVFTAGVTYMLALANVEGTLEEGTAIQFIAEYGFFLFPLIFLVFLATEFSIPVFLILLIANILLYAMIAAGLLGNKLAAHKRYVPFHAFFYTIVIILLVCILWIVLLILSGF